MITFPLLKRNALQMLKPLIIFIAVLGMYTGVIIYMYTPSLMSMLEDYQKAMPGMLQAFGMSGMATNLIEFINIYLYGFLMLVFPLIFIIVIGNSLVMNYVDSGSMACLLASPNSRRKIIVTQAISMIAGVVILMTVITIFGIVCSESMFPGALDYSKYIILNASTLLLQLAIAGIVFFAACFFNDSKNFYSYGAGIPLVFFLITMLANMGDKLRVLKFFSLYTLFPKDQIIAGESGVAVYNIALAVIAIILFTAGIVRFTKKDFSL
ncbi:ABC transporter permease subunit [[Clostridium] fimetarium]|uniref:ABC-2 type transport system permease protein n=1 Tax=[Clostridium] fimetarium TaxID=99656 RepID=A0A1I0MEP4_9FIRM|nr:ABC transporter permease subunit [[Clostridium] fimetarium]SEV86875.1 ABC-2 type transport system permease protein [[Clostridium] fimetarium]